MNVIRLVLRLALIFVGCSVALVPQSLQTTFPDANGSVFAVVSSGTTVFVGGSFTTIGGISRNGLAAINGATGAVLSWNPSPDRDGGGAMVRALALSSDGNSLFVGGLFSTIGGQTRHHLAKVDIATGNADASWDPNVSGIEGVEKMSVSTGDTVYFYGKDFTTINGSVSRPGSIAAVKGTGTGEATAFNPDGFIPITTRYIQVSPEGSTLYLGYNSLNVSWSGSTRNYFAALNTSDGSVTDMNPLFNQGVFCSAIVGNTIYFGGQFTSINGSTAVQKLAKFDASGGWSNASLVTNWNNTSATTPDGDIRAVCFSTNGAEPLLYIAGGFFAIGTTDRFKLAAVKASDATVQAWDPAGAGVQGGLNMRMYISTVNQKIYIADFMSSILGTSRSFLASVSGGTDPLPVELSTFTVSQKENSAILKWSTATEVNNHGFEVERKLVSRLGGQAGFKVQGSGTTASNSAWTRIAFVEGNGNSNTVHEYSYADRSLSAGTYSFRLKQIDRDGMFSYSTEADVKVGSVPNVFALEQNYPNPFNPSTSIGFTLQESGYTSLRIYDALGREVVTLVNEDLQAGVYHQRTFDAVRLSSGIYFSKLQSGENVQIRKMMLLK
ncbi:MAG: T9SS type A sorting domain-containing protein [Bacteroidota bacterium]